MSKKLKTSKKSMRVLVTILISLICINAAMMAATMIASATVNPTSTQVETNKVEAGSKTSEIQSSKIADKVAVSDANALPQEAVAEAPKVTENVVPTTTTNKTTTTKKTTTTTTQAPAPAAPTTQVAAATQAPAPAAPATPTTAAPVSTTISSGDIATLKNSVSANLISAFDQLAFNIVLNPNSSYLGYFSTSKHSIEMRSVSVSTFRHEIGHFLDVLKNMPSRSTDFAGIYSREKGLYTGTNAAYVTSNAQEYFAQSYRNYLEDASKLQIERPETFTFVVAQLNSISSDDITRTYNQYSWSW